MTEMRFYEVDVPTMVTVRLRGDGIGEAEAFEAARAYVDSLQPSENEAGGYSSVAFADRMDGLAITGASIEVTGACTAVQADED